MTRAAPKPKPAAKPKGKPKKRTEEPHDLDTGYIRKKGQGKTVEAFNYLTGTSVEPIDKERYALRPGKRMSGQWIDKTGKRRGGNIYYELRANRADLDPNQRL